MLMQHCASLEVDQYNVDTVVLVWSKTGGPNLSTLDCKPLLTVRFGSRRTVNGEEDMMLAVSP